MLTLRGNFKRLCAEGFDLALVDRDTLLLPASRHHRMLNLPFAMLHHFFDASSEQLLSPLLRRPTVILAYLLESYTSETVAASESGCLPLWDRPNSLLSPASTSITITRISLPSFF